MASQPVLNPIESPPTIPKTLRELLNLRETDTHYAVQTFSGATLFRPKAEVAFAWELLEGVYDDGKDTSGDQRRERESELAHDDEKYGVK